MGWMGLKSQLVYTLKAMGADCDENGNVLIFGAPVIQGLDDEEVVVNDEVEYTVQGQRRSVAGTMNSTGYGLRGIKVF